jgi:cytochrome d ubiquinol oxidase subunit I
VVGAASAFQLLRKPDQPESRTALRMAIGMFALVAPAQLVIGDLSGKLMAHYQPAKLAAVEAFWETRAEQAFHIAAWPDRATQSNRFELSIPKAGSLIVAGKTTAEIPGLKSFPREDQPPAAIVFWAFRIMVGLGLLMIALGFWGGFLWWRGRLEQTRLFLRAAVAMGPAGFVAVVSGWVVAEVGRQPFVVYGHLRTADAVSPVPAAHVGFSLIAFMVVYAVVFSAGALYILRLVVEGPLAAEPPPRAPRPPGTALGAVPGQSLEEPHDEP